MASKLVWHGRIVQKNIDRGIERNLTLAALFVVRYVKQSLSKAGPTKTSPKTPASKPGEPPHRRTGTLSRSITHEVTKDTARVGTNIKYAKALEVGYAPNNLAARPYLRPAVNKNRRQIKKLLGKKIR